MRGIHLARFRIISLCRWPGRCRVSAPSLAMSALIHTHVDVNLHGKHVSSYLARSNTCIQTQQLHTETALPCLTPSFSCLDACSGAVEEVMRQNMLIYEEFISKDEEQQLYEEVEPILERLRYEFDHWDNAIHGYRETEKKQWSKGSLNILQRVRDLAFPPGTPQLAYVHVLDLAKDGVIKPHVDSVRFCGHTIAGLSLLSASVMKLVHNADKSMFAHFLLQPRSLYIMRGFARFDYTHEVLGEADSVFKGQVVTRDRRISIICRNEPTDIAENS